MTIMRFVENKVTGQTETPSEGVALLVFNRHGCCLLCGHTPNKDVQQGGCCICGDCICCTQEGR